MDISKILEIKYPDHEWSLRGNGYENLTWSNNNSLAKPTEEELTDIWEEGEFQNSILLEGVRNSRRVEIMNAWPIESQFEALTESSMGRPEKLNELINFIIETKEKYPKP
jgi:hypothetical protein